MLGTILKFLLKGARRLIKASLLLIIFTAIAATIVIQISGDSDFQYPSDELVVNDVTKLNPIRVSNVARPETIQEISSAIVNSKGPISIGGGRYSQGGQTAYPDSLHIDMRGFNKVINLDQDNKEITVQAGITWRDIQEYIDPHNLSVKIMQTYANFTVGGSLSVNVHGRYISEGPLVHSVVNIKLVLADGSVVLASRNKNKELFYGAIGGYGGIGVIAEATLQLADNSKIERSTTVMSITDYKEHFFSSVRENKDVVFHNGDIYPPKYEKVRDVTWHISDKPLTHEERLIATDTEYKWGPKFAELVANYKIGKTIRESILEPVYYSFDRVVWRNWEASYDIRELEPKKRNKKTYVLREYFVPVEKFDEFIPKMRDIFQKHDANIINVSIRHAKADTETLLSWANTEVFAFVVYYQQGTDQVSKDSVKAWSVEMIDAVIEVGGTYYLPYQIFASAQQFQAAYPNSARFFELKRRIDPDYRFRNQLWKQHYPHPAEPISLLEAKSLSLKNYYRGEEQTFLTIPEWYLVFNPVEYANFLEANNNPSDFPFMASINEYWTLYDRVIALSKDNYPENSEYITVLRVIGISTTIEYMYKSLYENTIGRLTRWSTGNINTPEDEIISQAHRAYSELIFDKAWYEFDFAHWVGRIWKDTSFTGKNFIRKLERKLFFTLEYGFKTGYAKLIKLSAQTAYEQGDGLIYMTASVPDTTSITATAATEIISTDNEDVLLSVKRWGEFTKTIPVLAEHGYDFEDISGNHVITLTLIQNDQQAFTSSYAKKLFSSKLVSDSSKKRIAVVTKVHDLKEFILELMENKQPIEHIYDY